MRLSDKSNVLQLGPSDVHIHASMYGVAVSLGSGLAFVFFLFYLNHFVFCVVCFCYFRFSFYRLAGTHFM